MGNLASATMSATIPAYRTFVVYVEDLPGVLNRVASLFRRRSYNIVSLCVGRTHEPGVSRMTIVVEGDDDAAGRIEANLYKMVNVLRVDDITRKQRVARDLALFKVWAAPGDRAKVLQVCEIFRAHVVDMCADAVIVEATGTPDKIQGILAVLQELGVAEMVQTGTVAMTRGVEGVERPVLNSVSPGGMKPRAA